ncbi:hypothetical protein Vadar_006748 [Vaccinium darrowii]|uniref:Uncharacterized protein n=1 Tax=Vaccinium darrowii TaxID=229202 RepID=A0ACB7XX42_9ERIC|nr:hypothetical protein Vadar_006748 [Vaccinium darrowii]
MATASAGLAEAYVMRKLQKEKLKKNMADDQKIKVATYGDQAREVISNPRSQMKTSDSDHNQGCFFGMFKKIHPTSVASSSDSVS